MVDEWLRAGGRRPRRDRTAHEDVDPVTDSDLPPSPHVTTLPYYVEQETAPPTPNAYDDDDDEQLELGLLEETTVVDRTSTEPLTSMEELLSMSQQQPQRQQPLSVSSWAYQPRYSDINYSMCLRLIH